MNNYIIQIDGVVIEGIVLTSYQQQQLRESLEAELGRMFSLRGLPGDLPSFPGKISGETIRLQDRKPAPVQLGKQIASSVYKSLSGDK